MDEIGNFPPMEQIEKWGEAGLYQGIIKYHGGLTGLREKLGFPPKSKSNLEKFVKYILDLYVEDNYYLDNRRKLLYDMFNIELKHPLTDNFLEIDRYYPNYRVAIEIQGDQHKKEIKYFANRKGKTPSEYLKEVKLVDETKRQQCEDQNVILIEITENMTNEDILSSIENYLPIRKKPIKIKKVAFKKVEEEIIMELQKLQSNKESIITKEDVVRYNKTLYDNIRKYFGGINEARKLAGLSN